MQRGKKSPLPRASTATIDQAVGGATTSVGDQVVQPCQAPSTAVSKPVGSKSVRTSMRVAARPSVVVEDSASSFPEVTSTKPDTVQADNRTTPVNACTGRK